MLFETGRAPAEEVAADEPDRVELVAAAATAAAVVEVPAAATIENWLDCARICWVFVPGTMLIWYPVPGVKYEPEIVIDPELTATFDCKGIVCVGYFWSKSALILEETEMT